MDEAVAVRGEIIEPDGVPAANGEDPFPRERATALIRHLPAYAKLALRLARDRQVSRVRRAAVVAAAAYLVSPLDAIPGIIPVVGQLDDLLLGMAAIQFALAGLRPDERARHLAAVGLSDTALGEDMHHAGAIGAWMGRSGLRLGARGARAVVRAGRTGGSFALRGGATVVRGGATVVRGGAGALRGGANAIRSGADAARHGAEAVGDSEAVRGLPDRIRRRRS